MAKDTKAWRTEILYKIGVELKLESEFGESWF